MNILATRRKERGLTQPQVSAELKAADSRMDVGMVSRFESGACLPTREVMPEVEKAYGAPRTELWSWDELDLLAGAPCKAAEGPEEDEPVKGHGRKETRFRKCYRIPREFATSIPKDVLDVCGYSSWQSWHDAALRRLLGEYAARKKARRSA